MQKYSKKLNYISISGLIIAILSLTLGLVFGLGDFFSKNKLTDNQVQAALQVSGDDISGYTWNTNANKSELTDNGNIAELSIEKTTVSVSAPIKWNVWLTQYSTPKSTTKYKYNASKSYCNYNRSKYYFTSSQIVTIFASVSESSTTDSAITTALNNGNFSVYMYYDTAPMLKIDTAGGTLNGSTQHAAIYQEVGTTYKISTPTRDNYVFKGWIFSGGGSFNSSTNVYTFGALNTSGTLTAQWEQNPWTDQHESFSGEGTEENPYIIDTPQKLAEIAYQCNNGQIYSGKYFKQTANISLAGGKWVSIGDYGAIFGGTYDGGNFTISEMDSSTGLFNTVQGNLKNIRLENSSIINNSTGACGGIMAINMNIGGNIYNCYVGSDVEVISSGSYVGGIAGMTGVITNCVNYARVVGVDYVGGIVGSSMWGPISSCYNYGNVTGEDYVGGIAGNCGGNIEKCVSKAIVSGETYVGGIIGKAGFGTMTVKVMNCFASGQIKVSTGQNVACIVGVLAQPYSGEVVMTNCSFIGTSNRYLPLYNVGLWTGSTGTIDISSCYAKLNGEGLYIDGDFSGWGLVAGMNNGLPLQRELFFMAEVAPTFDVSWFANNGFSKLN